jgi:uncharacterized membrane protein YgcG
MSNFFRRKILGSYKICLLLISFFTLIASPVSAQYFTINTFRSGFTVKEDSSLIVKETIDVNFHQPRHGIVRDIPFKYQDELGRTIETPTKVVSVTAGAGRKWNYKVNKKVPIIRIRIGDPQKYVDGHQTYVIIYQVENAILFFKDHDELYWNVTGNDWRVAIQQASAEVNLVSKTKSRRLQASCYTGVYGSRESECDFETQTNNGRFFTKRDLQPQEGFTIAFGWDKGLISPPTSWKRFTWAINISENWVFLFSLLGLMSMLFVWYRWGRDPRTRSSIAVMYGPPKFENRPLTSAEVGTLVDERVDQRDITSLVIGLATKGYLNIEVKGESSLGLSTDYYLKKLKEPDAELTSFERDLINWIIPGNLSGRLLSDMSNNVYVSSYLLKESIYKELIRKKYLLINPEWVKHAYRVAGVVIMVCGSVLFVLLNPDSIGKNILASVLAGLPALALAGFMPAKTKTGSNAYVDILGFQEFLNRAEKDRIERMGDQELFSKFLPDAIALGVAENWARAFKGIYQKIPLWYISQTEPGTFDPSTFSYSMDFLTSHLESAMFSAPRGWNEGRSTSFSYPGGSGLSGGDWSGSSGDSGSSGGGLGGGGEESW